MSLSYIFWRVHIVSSTYWNSPHKHRNKSIKITNVITIAFAIVTTLEWILFPLMLRLLSKTETSYSNQRFENIFNFQFPVTVSEYNNNYFIFYIMESFFPIFLFYRNVMNDVFFISICYVIIAQCDIIKLTYTIVNFEQSSENNNGKSRVIFFYVPPWASRKMVRLDNFFTRCL